MTLVGSISSWIPQLNLPQIVTRATKQYGECNGLRKNPFIRRVMVFKGAKSEDPPVFMSLLRFFAANDLRYLGSSASTAAGRTAKGRNWKPPPPEYIHGGPLVPSRSAFAQAGRVGITHRALTDSTRCELGQLALRWRSPVAPDNQDFQKKILHRRTQLLLSASAFRRTRADAVKPKPDNCSLYGTTY